MKTIGIVVSKWYWEDITGPMCELAEKTAQDAGYKTVVVKVPGSFEIPWGVHKIINDVDGVVTLGAVIEGKTDHDKIIAHSVAAKFLDLSLQHNKPVLLGVNGPKMTHEDAIKRIERAKHVTQACIELLE